MGSNSFIRFLAALAALSFFFIFACSPDDDGNSGAMDGTWEMDEFTLKISGNNYFLKSDGEDVAEGTVTYNNSTFVFIITREVDWRNGGWVNVSGVRIFGNYTQNGDASVFSEVYIDYGKGDEPESYSMFDGEWKKIK
jgi:hypothetical protein